MISDNMQIKFFQSVLNAMHHEVSMALNSVDRLLENDNFFSIDGFAAINTARFSLKRDLRLIEDLMIDYSLKAGVVNVLIDYVLKTNNNKLSRNLVETVAGQWQRLKIETVEDAMSLAEKEHKKYNKVKDKKVSIQEEKIPEWFDKKIEKKEVNTINKSKIDELLKEYR